MTQNVSYALQHQG